MWVAQTFHLSPNSPLLPIYAYDMLRTHIAHTFHLSPKSPLLPVCLLHNVRFYAPLPFWKLKFLNIIDITIMFFPVQEFAFLMAGEEERFVKRFFATEWLNVPSSGKILHTRGGGGILTKRWWWWLLKRPCNSSLNGSRDCNLYSCTHNAHVAFFFVHLFRYVYYTLIDYKQQQQPLRLLALVVFGSRGN